MHAQDELTEFCRMMGDCHGKQHYLPCLQIRVLTCQHCQESHVKRDVGNVHADITRRAAALNIMRVEESGRQCQCIAITTIMFNNAGCTTHKAIRTVFLHHAAGPGAPSAAEYTKAVVRYKE